MDVLEPIGMVEEDAALVEEIAGKIRALNLQHGVPWARAVGELVLHAFFHGDVELYRTRGPKHVSLRKLGERDDIGITRVTLGRAIRVAILCRELPRKVVGELELNQGYALLLVPKDKVRDAAQAAVEKRLDAQAIRAEFPNPDLKPTAKGEARFGTSVQSAKKHVARLAKGAATWAVTAKRSKVEAYRKDLLAMQAELAEALAALPEASDQD